MKMRSLMSNRAAFYNDKEGVVGACEGRGGVGGHVLFAS